jgi:hypothetical protein
MPPLPAQHPGFGTFGLPQLLVIFVALLSIYGFFRLRL